MEIKVKSYSTQSSLISSIIFFIIGAILFTSAEKVISTISIIVGSILAVAAIIELIIFFIQNKKETKSSENIYNLILAIICLIFAFIFIFFSNIVEQFIRFVIGAWVLFSGIIRFINVLSINPKNQKFIPLLIVSIALMIIGVYTIVCGDIILSTIGIIMMIYAIVEIIGYIFYTKDTITNEEPGTTTLIIPEDEEDKKEVKTDKKKKKIKTVKNKIENE